jgi:diguanylate cyclase (GGDEF)-like protein
MFEDIVLLYVEDDKDISEEIAFFLKKRVKRLLLAENGEEGLELFIEYSPDIVMSDIQMPKMDGLVMSQKIRDLNRDVPIIITSAYNDTDFLNRAIELGVSGYITKPINLAKMIETLEKSLEPLRLKAILQERNSALEEINGNLDVIVQQKTADLEFLYHHDGLTSLKNIIALQEDIKTGHYQYLILLDIANFSYINKQYGKEFGDKVLVAIAKLLDGHSNADVSLYKTESDRFVFLVKDMGRDDVSEFCGQIHSFFDNKKIDIDGVMLSVVFNIGIASFKIEDRVIIHAEYALDIAKEMGARFYFFYNEEDALIQKHKSMIEWLDITKEMIENDDIVPYYQAILETKTDAIVKFEVLARGIFHDKIIPPSAFIEPATRLGLISSITKMMIQKSFMFFQDKPYSFSINISERDLYEEYLVEYLQIRAHEYNIEPSRVTLEILENITTCIRHESIMAQINRIRELGFQIAIDDFGTENANFSRLMHIQFDYIKLDGVFIRNLSENTKQQLIVKSIVELAKVLGVQTVAEYVENEHIYAAAKECGIDFVQGYYCGVPCENIDNIDNIGDRKA